MSWPPCPSRRGLRPLLRVRWSESRAWPSSSRCDCQTARLFSDKRDHPCCLRRGDAGVLFRPSIIDRGGRSAAKRNVSVSDAASRQHRSASPCERRHARLAALHPAKLAQAGLCHGRRFRSLGPCFRGADRWGDRSLRDRTPPAPAGFGPRSSGPRPALCSGRPHLVEADGKPRASRTHGCEPCARAPHPAPPSRRLMMTPLASRTEIGL